MGILDPHASNRNLLGLNIPDFGLSEMVSDYFNQGRTSQGGSNLFGDQSQTTLVPSGTGSFVPSGPTGDIVTPQTPPTTTGGTFTGGTTGGTTTGGVVPGETVEDQARNAYFSYLDEQSGRLTNTQRELENQINSLAGGYRSTIETNQQGLMEDIGQARANVNVNKASSLRDLEQNMRNQMSAGAKFLGNVPGASSSTAPGMYNYALSKLGSRNRNDILKQTNQLQSNLDIQQNKIKSTYTDQLAQLDSWKGSQLANIASQISSARGQIDAQKAAYIQNQLIQIDSEMTAYKQMLQQWAMNNSTSLDQLRKTLQGLVTSSPTTIVQPALSAALNLSTQNPGTNLYGVTTNSRKQIGTDSLGRPIYES